MEFDHVVEKQQEQKAVPLSACLWKSGAFNISYRVQYEDGIHVIVRFAALGRAILRREKVQNEVAVMNYIRRSTSIPVPEVFGSDICWAGPYIVMSFIEGEPLSQLLRDRSVDGRPVLNPHVSDRSLKRAYREMAMIMVELSKFKFDAIGAIDENEEGTVISRRPLTFNMNELMASANLLADSFGTKTFRSATEYFETLAMHHLDHLRLQRNDAVDDAEDCRKKYTAHCLLLKVINNLGTSHPQGPFRLYCDDFRPSNVLVNLSDLRVSAVIDWEFAYAAPSDFVYVAPWWLLLQSPEDWESDLNEFLGRYTPRLEVFLDALRESENNMIENHRLSESQRLSHHMGHSMENGLFWVRLAARYSSIIDEIYWTFIDPLYYGPFRSLEDRIQLLTHEQQHKMNELSVLKMSQGNETFEDHYSIDRLLEL